MSSLMYLNCALNHHQNRLLLCERTKEFHCAETPAPWIRKSDIPEKRLTAVRLPITQMVGKDERFFRRRRS
jgi:hypothetical protein